MAKGYFINPDTKQEYFGYDFISFKAEYDGRFNFKRFLPESPGNDESLYYNSLYIKKVISNVDKVTPTLNSKLFLDAGNPYANADVRKSYSITYKPEKVDYIVISQQKLNERYYADFLVLPALNKIIRFDFPDGNSNDATYRKKAEAAVKLVFPDEWIMDNSVWINSKYFQYNGKIDIRGAYDDSTNKIAWYSSLSLNAGEELTVDALMIFTQAAKVKGFSSENEKNCVLAMQMINNLNWRTYPGTMSRLVYLLDKRDTILGDMRCHPSRFPKPITEMLTHRGYYDEDFAGEKDYNLWLEYMKKYMRLEEEKFVKMGDVKKRLNGDGVYEQLFYQTFSCITRIKPKSYDDYLSEKQV